jgi:tetratricopeptide (TPR) repeat protein
MCRALYSKACMIRISAYLVALSICVMQGTCSPAQTSSANEDGRQSGSVSDHQQKAAEYLRQRQTELARKEFAIIVEAEPGNVDAQANLGILLYFDGQYKGAIPHLQAALALLPQQGKLRALLGFSERRVGDTTAARNDLLASLGGLTENKVRKQAGLELVEMDTAANDLPAAAATIGLLKAAMPEDVEVLYAAYRVYTDLAGEALLDLSLAGPESSQIHQAMAHELMRERNNTAAIANLRAALKSDANLPGAHFELAELLASSSDPSQKAEAAREYEAALKQNPNDDKTLARLGDMAADEARHEGAMDYYKRALALQPENADAAIGLAHEQVDTGHVEEAAKLLTQVIQNDPSNTLAHYRLIAVYRRMHRTEDAKREVAEYQRLKAMKEKLRGVYDALRLDTSPRDDAKE